MSDPYRSTGRHRTRKPSDTDEHEPISTAPEHTLREVLESAPLDVGARVATDKLIAEIADRSKAQDARIAELERKGTWWQRARAVAGTVGAAGVLSALAVVAAQLIAHGDSRAEARQQRTLLDSVSNEVDKIRLQVTTDHALLQLCATRLGVVQGASP